MKSEGSINKLKRVFVISSVVIFLFTGAAKILTAAGGVPALKAYDPIFDVKLQYLLVSVGVVEILLAVACWFTRKDSICVGMIACLATNFAAYRVALWGVGWRGPCGCLGNLTAALHIPLSQAESITKWFLIYLLLGSYAFCAAVIYQKSRRIRVIGSFAEHSELKR